MKGTRKEPDADGNLNLKPGEYGKHGRDGNWYCCPPGREDWFIGNLQAHQVTEHEDGTITAAPSILIKSWNGTWHGYLERGVFREV